ncbi:MAG: bifunctional serine/threonine-protein kinase/universal stress protein [Burkholderiaceae bacterium]
MASDPIASSSLGTRPGEELSASLTRLQPGDEVDGFRIEEMLHQGGMATLWRVHRIEPAAGGPQLPLLMKVPRIMGGEDPASIVGFEVEAMIMPTLSGPHVPRFVAKGDFTRRPYIVMEHIDGPSLKPVFDASPVSLDEIVETGSRVAEALHDLHRQHVVHLDIKPSNVVMRPDGTAVLIDFGLSRHDRLPDLLEEQFRLPMGTGPYMSPEQVQYIRSDPRSDIFALGVMLYKFTTGERPFGAPHTVRGLRKRLYMDPVPPRTLRPDCPPWLQEIILRCLEVKPERRYQSAAQLALALQAPDQVPLTDRSRRQSRRGGLSQLRRWFFALGSDPDSATVGVAPTLHRSPIIVAAVDTEGSEPALLEALRETTRRLVATERDSRLACISVMKTARIGIDERVDDKGRSLHVKRLVHLKHWARPIGRALALDDMRLTYHVLEAPDAADAIVGFAQRVKADQIVMGARASSTMRRYLGSVSSQVVAAAGCTVTVVKISGDANAEVMRAAERMEQPSAAADP